jgi:hypothetical protein
MGQLGIYGMTKQELLMEANGLEIEGAAKMKKDDLLNAVALAQGLPTDVDVEALAMAYDDRGGGPGVPELPVTPAPKTDH